MRMLRRGTSAAALKRLGENVLCLRLLGHDRLGATKFSLGARIGPGSARIGPRTAAIGLAFCEAVVSERALKLKFLNVSRRTPGARF